MSIACISVDLRGQPIKSAMFQKWTIMVDNVSKTIYKSRSTKSYYLLKRKGIYFSFSKDTSIPACFHSELHAKQVLEIFRMHNML